MEQWWNNNYQQEETEVISEKSASMVFVSPQLPTGPYWGWIWACKVYSWRVTTCVIMVQNNSYVLPDSLWDGKRLAS